MQRTMTGLLFVSALITNGCKEPFDQKTPANSTDYLVVEGTINPSGPTTISLTRSLRLSDRLAVRGEVKAAVQVEGETSGTFPLAEKANGIYTASQLNLSNSQKYRLRIKTLAGKTYLSDFLPVKVTPPIDSISWERTPDGVEIYANTHDDKKATRYYQWSYDEDWEIHSVAESFYTTKVIVIQNSGFFYLVPRTPAQTQMLFTCYKKAVSSVISIFSTVKLDDDLVHKFPLQTIPNGSDRLDFRYSILVRQQALSKEAFEYLSLMKKNTETGGSLFNSQPTEIKGNIHNATDPNEIVLGFAQIAPVVEKRIWIEPSQVPGWKVALGCNFFTVSAASASLGAAFDADDFGVNIPTRPATYKASGEVETIEGGTSACVDCRLRGGTNIKPTFW